MAFLSGLALVLLALAGYAGGITAACRDRRVDPGLLDVGAILALWVVALTTRSALRVAESSLANRWIAVAIWLLVGLALGGLLGALRRGRYPAEKPAPSQCPAAGWRGWWERWTGFAARMGGFQSRVWLALFYLVVVLPFGVGVRLLSDPLGKNRSSDSRWVAKQQPGSDLESARSQF